MKHALARKLRFFAFLLAALLLVPTSGARAEDTPALDAKVSKVVDGDTFTLSGESRRIRVWGLDAPEWNQPGGGAATAGLRGLISGKRGRSSSRVTSRHFDHGNGSRAFTFKLFRSG